MYSGNGDCARAMPNNAKQCQTFALRCILGCLQWLCIVHMNWSMSFFVVRGYVCMACVGSGTGSLGLD